MLMYVLTMILLILLASHVAAFIAPVRPTPKVGLSKITHHYGSTLKSQEVDQELWTLADQQREKANAELRAYLEDIRAEKTLERQARLEIAAELARSNSVEAAKLTDTFVQERLDMLDDIERQLALKEQEIKVREHKLRRLAKRKTE